ncbi:MAG: NAD-dependent epimerase/dehydratase family protein [Bryobacterales bacterium]|nr:NAD-dependent epimerase/dehydratase family protein [Bryobacterales bacterium]
MRIFITGAAGFIGSNLADHLLTVGHTVIGYDKLITGRMEFIDSALRNSNFKLIQADLLDFDTLREAMTGAEMVFHLAANADVRHGPEHTRLDMEQNTIATYNVLEAMRLNNVPAIAFSSTGSVYGEAAVIPTPETAPFPIQTSLYGASKLAAEGLISAFSEAFGIRALIFRFVSILGPRYSHGHVFDFLKQLRSHPESLHILGNGKQRKSYLHVSDCVSAIMTAVERAPDRVSIYNLGTDEYCEVNDSVGWICQTIGVNPQRTYSGGDRGWIGDNPFIFLDCSAIRSLGWKPRYSIREGIVSTIEYLQANPWLLDSRDDH